MIHRAKNNSAVSPVIGTILLVAIAVVLALIILTVITGLTGDANEKKVGLNAKPQNGNNATLILYGGASIDELIKLEMIDQSSPNGEYVELWNITDGSAFVGIPYLAKDVAQPLESMAVYDTRIIVRGTFNDGTKIILLVQPMTFYDVGPGKTGPAINAPEVHAADTDSRNKIFTVFYSNATSAPTNCIIYYQPKGEPDKAVSIDTGTGNAPNGKFSTQTVTLEQGVTYEIWGELIIDEKKYKGPVREYAVTDLQMWISANTNNREENLVEWGIGFMYRNAILPPSEAFICYQPVNDADGSQLIRLDFGERTVKSESISSIVTLTPGVTYKTWGGVVVNGEESLSSTTTFAVSKPDVNYPTFTSEGNGFVSFTGSYRLVPSQPIECNICYYPSNNPEEIQKLRTGPGEYRTDSVYTSFTTDPVMLKGGHYAYTEIITEYGTFTSVHKYFGFSG